MESRQAVELSNTHALVGRHEVLDVDEGVVAAVGLHDLQRLLDQVAQVDLLALSVVDRVAQVVVLPDEDVENREDLAVVRHHRLADEPRAVAGLRGRLTGDHELQDVQRLDDDLLAARVERVLDGDDELRDHRQHLCAGVDEHVFDALLRQERVRLLDFSKAVEEDGKIVVEVELGDVDLPRHHVAHTAVIDLNRQVPALVEAAERRVWRIWSLLERHAWLRLGPWRQALLLLQFTSFNVDGAAIARVLAQELVGLVRLGGLGDRERAHVQGLVVVRG